MMETKNEIILYKPNATVQLEVRLENDTVWLMQQQIADLFGVKQPAISKHIKNIFASGELDENSVYSILEYTASDGKVYKTGFYNLDVILSVGYRVNSVHATLFRKWANSVLKDYLLRGYAVNQRFAQIDDTLLQHKQMLLEHQKQIDFFIRTELPPKEGVFYDGQIFEAYKFLSDLIETAKREITVIDNYADASVLTLLSKRRKGVSATIFTKAISNVFQLDLRRYNEQYPAILVVEKPNIHDRFLLIDDDLYHIGASFKDLGKKLFAFNKMEMTANELLQIILRQETSQEALSI